MLEHISSQCWLHIGKLFKKTGKEAKSKPDKITKRNCEEEYSEKNRFFKSWNMAKLLMPKPEIL